MGVLRREGMHPLTDEFAEEYRKFRERHKMGRSATRHRKKGMSGPLSESIDPEEFRSAMRDALAAFSGKSGHELTGVLQNVLAAEYRIDSSDHTSELPSLKTAQNILREPHSISIRNYEALLSWLEYEIFDVSRRLDMVEHDEAPSRQSGETSNELSEKLFAYCQLQRLLTRLPEEYETALSKEYAARALVAAVQILSPDDREHLLQQAELLLGRESSRRPRITYSRDESGGIQQKIAQTPDLDRLVQSLNETACGKHVDQGDLCRLIADGERVRSTLEAAISAKARSIEKNAEATSVGTPESTSYLTDFDLRGLVTGSEGDVAASIVLDEYVGGLDYCRKEE